jgi:hypothetical protein
MAQTRIAELASIISTKTGIIDQYLQSHNIASPSFDLDYVEPAQLPPEIAVCKIAISEATEELNSLLASPSGFWMTSLDARCHTPESVALTYIHLDNTPANHPRNLPIRSSFKLPN